MLIRYEKIQSVLTKQRWLEGKKFPMSRYLRYHLVRGIVVAYYRRQILLIGVASSPEIVSKQRNFNCLFTAITFGTQQREIRQSNVQVEYLIFIKATCLSDFGMRIECTSYVLKVRDDQTKLTFNKVKPGTLSRFITMQVRINIEFSTHFLCSHLLRVGNPTENMWFLHIKRLKLLQFTGT